MPTLTSVSATAVVRMTPVALMSITAAREVAVMAWSATAADRLRGLKLIA